MWFIATVLLSGMPLASRETVVEVPFDLYQHHLVVTKGAIGPLNGLSLLIDTGTIPSVPELLVRFIAGSAQRDRTAFERPPTNAAR